MRVFFNNQHPSLWLCLIKTLDLDNKYRGLLFFFQVLLCLHYSISKLDFFLSSLDSKCPKQLKSNMSYLIFLNKKK